MTQKERFQELLDKNGLNQVGLLKRIYNDLEEKPAKYPTAYEFASDISIKTNFSKMVSGERPFKYEYIAPIEKYLKTSLLYILKGGENKVPSGVLNSRFEYAAYLNSYDEFAKFLEAKTKSDDSVILNADEYGKSIIDYIVEYEADEGIRFLHDTASEHYPLVMRHNSYCDAYFKPFRDESGYLYISKEDVKQIIKILAKKEKWDILMDFLEIPIIIKGKYTDETQLLEDWFSRLALENEGLLERMLCCFSIDLKDINPGLYEHGYSFNDGIFINPLVRSILSFALKNPENYKKEIKRILGFVIKVNRDAIDLLSDNLSSITNVLVSEEGFVGNSGTKLCGICSVSDEWIPADLCADLRRDIDIIRDQTLAIQNIIENKNGELERTWDAEYKYKRFCHSLGFFNGLNTPDDLNVGMAHMAKQYITLSHLYTRQGNNTACVLAEAFNAARVKLSDAEEICREIEGQIEKEILSLKNSSTAESKEEIFHLMGAEVFMNLYKSDILEGINAE